MSNRRREKEEPFRAAIVRGSAVELQNLLANQTYQNGLDRVLLSAGWQRPECARLLIEAGADFQWNGSERQSLLVSFLWIFNRDEDIYLEGEVILLFDILMYYVPTFWTAAVELEAYATNTNGELIARKLRSDEIDEGTRKCREREGVISLLEGRYWQEYGGRNPFFEASTAQEMVALLNDGASNNEDGKTDMTRLRSIRPALRRSVMELLQQHVVDRKSLAELHVSVANNKALGAISSLSGLEKAIFPIIADFLGVRGRPLDTARNALATFNELATGRFESEYDAGDW